MKHYYLSLPTGYEIYDGNGNHMASANTCEIAEIIVSSLNYDDSKCFDALSEIVGVTEVDAMQEKDLDELNDRLLEIATIANYALMESL